MESAFKINDKVTQVKTRHEQGTVIEVLPFNRYRVQWDEMKNTSTYSAEYLRPVKK